MSGDRYLLASSLKDGVVLVARSIRYIALAWLSSIVLALVLSAAIYDSLYQSFGSSQASQSMLNGFDDTWYQNYESQARGLELTFTPSVIGPGVVLDGIDALVADAGIKKIPAALLVLAAIYVLTWTALSAGFIGHYSSSPSERPSFGRSVLNNFRRVAPLTALALFTFWAIFSFVDPVVGRRVYQFVSNQLDEKPFLIGDVFGVVLVWTPILATKIVLDCAKVLAVVDRDMSLIRAPLIAARMVGSNIGKVICVYAILGSLWAVLIVTYALVAPSVSQASIPQITLAFLAGQLLIVLRIWIRCQFLATQSVMYAGLLKAGRG